MEDKQAGNEDYRTVHCTVLYFSPLKKTMSGMWSDVGSFLCGV